MPGYKHPCRYCQKLVPPDANVCPFCGKRNPSGSLKCPKCRNPIHKDWTKCSNCGLSLEAICPQCRRATFFGDYCQHCEAQLVVVCPEPKCKTEQPPVGDLCIKCGRSLKK